MSVRDFDDAERGLVTRPDQRSTLEPVRHMPSVAKHLGQQVVGDHHPVAVA